MWKQLAQFGKDLLTLKGQVKENTSEINEIRQELRDLTEFVRSLHNIVNQDRTKNETQREILIEKLKNALLQFENDLLRGKYPNAIDRSKDNNNEA